MAADQGAEDHGAGDQRVGDRGQRPREDQRGVAVDDLQRLWAPWRAGYLGGGDRIDGCPFCVLPARGPDEDARSLILLRGRSVFAILNAYPYNPGHLMVVPYAHEADLERLDAEVAVELFEVARRAVGLLRRRLRAQGVNLGMNLGAAGGAGIADHLHLHAVPRWSGDTNFVSVVGASRILPRALEDVYAALAPGFSDA